MTVLPDAVADRALPIATWQVAWRRVRSVLGRRRGLMVVVVITTVVAAVSGLVGPYVIGTLVDVLQQPTRAEAARRSVITAGVAVAVAAVVGGVFAWVGLRALAQAGEAAVAELREDAVGRALELDSATVERAGTGDLVSRVAEDARIVADATTEIIPLVCTSIISVAVSAIGLLIVDWRLGLIGLVAIPLYWLSLRWYLPRSGPYYAAERAAFAERASHLLGGITGAETLRAFGTQQVELTRIDATSAKARDLAIEVFGLLTRLFGRNNRAEAVVLGLILGAGFWLVFGGWVTAGAVATAALLFHRLFNPLGAIVVLFDEVQSAGASLTRLVGVAEAPVRMRDHDQEPFVRAATQLRADQVRHHYPGTGAHPGQDVLIDVSVRVAAGELVALVGSTGAGKTTLANAMAGVIETSSGGCLLDDRPVRGLDPAELRRQVCLVSQEVHTFAGTVAADVTLARPDADDELTWSALRTVGADGWVAALPDGLQTVVGDGGHRLTTVQAQQLALARVVIADPPFVVLDEATAEAGSSGSKVLDLAAGAVLAGRGALVVAHRLSQARAADRIVVLEAGRVVEQGSHDDLVDAGGRYAELWRAWAAHG